MTGQRIASDVRTVARIDRGYDEEMVDAVVCPEELAVRAAANEVIEGSGGGIRTTEEVTDDLERVEITVAADTPVAGNPWRPWDSP